jgi:2-polyprenyl-3-methyl-5-hydroxy-6-metoxy-1,4-benzoquinol methylase
MTAVACTACASNESRHEFSTAGFDVFRCGRCSHAFVPDQGLAAELDAAYAKAYYQSEGESDDMSARGGYGDYLAKIDQRKVAFGDRLDWIEASGARGGAILDYGCAVGLFVKVAQDRGWKAAGYERSAWAAQFGRDKFGIRIEQGFGEHDPFGAASFDVVTMWDVIEHVENPRRILQLIKHWIKPGGTLAVTTVNASSLGARLAGRRWRHLIPPHHLQFFTRQSLTALLTGLGFHIASVRCNGTFLQSAVTAAPSAWRDSVDRAVGYWRLRPLVSRLDLFDEIEILAVAPHGNQ